MTDDDVGGGLIAQLVADRIGGAVEELALFVELGGAAVSAGTIRAMAGISEQLDDGGPVYEDGGWHTGG